MLKAVPKGWFTTKFVLVDYAKPVGLIAMAWGSESATIRIGSETYRTYRQGFMSGLFLLESANGGIFATADKPSAFVRSFQLTFDGQTFALEAESAFFRKFILRDRGEVIGSIYPNGIFTRASTIDLPESFPLPLRAFMFWLVALLWKRASDSAAAGA
jgi:hypothetical protein